VASTIDAIKNLPHPELARVSAYVEGRTGRIAAFLMRAKAGTTRSYVL
jgi:hypothetical protein